MTLFSQKMAFLNFRLFGTLESSGRRWCKQRGSISHNVHISVAIAFLESLQGSEGWEMHTRPQHISVNGDCNPQFLSGLITFKITHFGGISYFQTTAILGSFRPIQFIFISCGYPQKIDFVGRKVQCEYSSQPRQINSIFSEQKAHHRIHYGTYGLLYGDESGCKTIFQGAYGSV